MDPIDPRIHPNLVRAGSRAVVVAETQDEYKNLPSVRTPQGQLITRWEPTAEERARIAAGDDIFVTVINGGPVSPMMVTVGPMDWTACWMCGAAEGADHEAWCKMKPEQKSDSNSI